MNLYSDFRRSHMRKFDVDDSKKMSISQKLAAITPVRTRSAGALTVFGP